MKTFKIISIISLIVLLGGCSTLIDDELTEFEVKKIKKDIQLVWDGSMNAILNYDASGAFAIFNKDETTKYIRDGYLYPSIDEALKQYTSWFDGPRPKRSMEIQFMDVNVLDKRTAIQNAIVDFAIANDSTDQHIMIGYTLVWEKEHKEWKVTTMHTSMSENQ